MMDQLYQLLGVDLTGNRPVPQGLFFARPWPFWLALLLGAGALAWVIFFYRRDGTRAAAARYLPATCRIAALVLVALLLWQPALWARRRDVTRSVAAILVDRSASMALRDQWKNAASRKSMEAALGPAGLRATRAENAAALLNRQDGRLLADLERSHELRLYQFGEGAAPAPPVRSSTRRGEKISVLLPAAADPESRLGAAIQTALDDTAGQPLAAVVLLSDGGQNAGEDPLGAAGRARERGAPVYTVPLGDPTPPRDLSIATLLVDEVLRRGDQAVVSATLHSRGYGGRRVPVVLSLAGREVARKMVTLPAGDAPAEVTLLFHPQAAGAHTLTLSTPVLSGETSPSNNRRAAPVRVVDHRLRILYLEGQPRWEYRYLKNAILRDQRILFSCLLADGEASGGEGNVPIAGFPSSREALFEFDIIILGDVPRVFFSGADLQNLRAFVEERGGSLVVIAGENSMPWEYRGSPLEQVLPVKIPAVRRELLFEEPFQLELTPEGARHPMLLLGDGFAQNRDLWHSLPGMYWCGVADGIKPGATLLAQHPDRRSAEGRLPLMVIQQAGEGECFMTMVDSTWQWRYRVGDRYFYRFWGQVVRSMTPHELPGANRFVRLAADRPRYRPGETVTLRARLLTPAYRPVRAPVVEAEVVGEDGQRYAVRMSPAGAAGVYTAAWIPQKPGRFRAVVKTPGGGRAESLTGFLVEEQNLELENPAQNQALLRRIARDSGGEYIPPDRLQELPARLPNRNRETVSRVEYPLWHAPLALLLLGLLLTGEWVLRKRAGLL